MIVVKDETHFHVDIGSGNGDEIQFNAQQDGGLDVEIVEPMAGSTETGFGATASATLSRTQAIALRDWLCSVIK